MGSNVLQWSIRILRVLFNTVFRTVVNSEGNLLSVRVRGFIVHCCHFIFFCFSYFLFIMWITHIEFATNFIWKLSIIICYCRLQILLALFDTIRSVIKHLLLIQSGLPTVRCFTIAAIFHAICYVEFAALFLLISSAAKEFVVVLSYLGTIRIVVDFVVKIERWIVCGGLGWVWNVVFTLRISWMLLTRFFWSFNHTVSTYVMQVFVKDWAAIFVLNLQILICKFLKFVELGFIWIC